MDLEWVLRLCTCSVRLVRRETEEKRAEMLSTIYKWPTADAAVSVCVLLSCVYVCRSACLPVDVVVGLPAIFLNELFLFIRTYSFSTQSQSTLYRKSNHPECVSIFCMEISNQRARLVIQMQTAVGNGWNRCGCGEISMTIESLLLSFFLFF